MNDKATERVAAKACTKCGALKPLQEFNRDSSIKDGHSSRCKLCARAAVKAWRRANPERSAAHQRAHNKRHPGKYKARAAITDRVHRGSLTKPEACERCGETFSPNKLHGHHHDYDKPLEVEWLCEPCHKAVHQEPAPPWTDLPEEGER